jgi:hypothetical protein
MISKILSLVACLTLADAPAENRGAISGVVVNASQDKTPVAGCKVVLRARLENQFVVLGETSADPWGRFQFVNLPAGKYYEYLPGANRDGVHYAGPLVHITAEEPLAAVELSVCDSIAAPSPLVLTRHEISLRPESGVLYVTESLTVDNPSSTCYVGQAPREGAEPVTLQLSIPPEFERATFDEEYFGRRFAASQGKLITGLAWPPGKKEVKFTYVIRNAEISRHWQRPLDLPCSDLCVRVQTTKPEEIACNLGRGTIAGNEAKSGPSEVVFHSTGKLLPAGFVIGVELNHLPVPWMAYARWTALFTLIGAVAGTSIFTVRRRRSNSRIAAKQKINDDCTQGNHPPKHTPQREG